MSSQLPAPAGRNTFERIKRVNAKGNESWSARDLAQVLEYLNFRNFEPVIQKAKEACLKSGHAVADHFAQMRNMVNLGSGAQREVEDWALSRYACYLVIQNADPSKPLVALGQTYFAVQTRRQEMADDEAVKEDKMRLLLRAEMKKHNKNLAGVAKQSGVIDPLDYAIFMDHGYRGLYGGLGMRDIRERKRLKPKQQVLDHMGSTELAANLFRGTQTEEKLRRENVRPFQDRSREREFALTSCIFEPTHVGCYKVWRNSRAAKFARPFTNWAARCLRICPWPRASRKSRAGRRNGSKRDNLTQKSSPPSHLRLQPLSCGKRKVD